MKIIDIKDKPIIYCKNLGDEYYWEYKLIVQVDENNYCLINYDDSYSGYISFNMECVDEEFVSAFMKNPYADDFINFNKTNKLLSEFIINKKDIETATNSDVVLIPKEKIQYYLDILDKEENNE